MTLNYELHPDYTMMSVTADIYDADDEEVETFVTAEVDLHVGPWDRSYYRPTEREMSVNKLVVREFGRVYEFSLYEALGEQDETFEQEVIEFYEEMEKDY